MLYASLEVPARASTVLSLQIVSDHAQQNLRRAGVILHESMTGLDDKVTEAGADEAMTLSETGRLNRRPIPTLDHRRHDAPRR